MIQQTMAACVIISCIMSGCSSKAILPPSQSSTPAPEQVTMAGTETPASTRTATVELSPTPSLTHTPEPTPTEKYTATPAAISPLNVGSLQKDASYSLPVRGKLDDALWSRNGELLLVSTDLGISLISRQPLEQLALFPDSYPLYELEDGSWIVWSGGQRKVLKQAGGEFELTSFDDMFTEKELDLISADGETAVRQLSDVEIEIISLTTGDRRSFDYRKAGFFLDYADPVVISPDGKYLVVGYTDWPDLNVLNLETMQVIYDLGKTYSDPVFSPDGQYILFSDNGGIKVHNARNGIPVNRFSEGFVIRPTPKTYTYYSATAFDWLPDSQHIGVIYCVQEETCALYIWSMETGQPETIMKELPVGIDGLDFSPNGDTFVTVSSAGILSTWSLDNQSILAENKPYDRDKPVISPDGRLAAFARGTRIEIIDLETGDLAAEIGEYPDQKHILVDAITDNYLLVAGVDSLGGFEDVWDLKNGGVKRKIRPLDSPDTYSGDQYCTLSWNENRIACGQSPLQIFDLDTGALLYSNKASEGQLVWAMSPDGKYLATCTVVLKQKSYYEYDAIPGDRIFVHELDSATPVITEVLEAAQGGICSPLIFSPDGDYLAAQSGYIWKSGQSQPFSSFPKLGEAPMSFDMNGALLVSGSRLIQTETGAVLAELAIESPIMSVSFDPGGYRLVLVTGRSVDIWKVHGD